MHRYPTRYQTQVEVPAKAVPIEKCVKADPIEKCTKAFILLTETANSLYREFEGIRQAGYWDSAMIKLVQGKYDLFCGKYRRTFAKYEYNERLRFSQGDAAAGLRQSATGLNLATQQLVSTASKMFKK